MSVRWLLGTDVLVPSIVAPISTTSRHLFEGATRSEGLAMVDVANRLSVGQRSLNSTIGRSW